MKRCKQCQAALPDVADYCGNCGMQMNETHPQAEGASSRLPTVSSLTSVEETFVSRSLPVTPIPLYTDAQLAAGVSGSYPAVLDTSPAGLTVPSAELAIPLDASSANAAQSLLSPQQAELKQPYPVFEPEAPWYPSSNDEAEFAMPPVASRPAQSKLVKWLIVLIICLTVISGSIATLLFIMPTHRPQQASSVPVVTAKLSLTPSSLDFGSLAQGSNVILALIVANEGKSPLQWQADTGGSAWLKLAVTRGTLAPGGARQMVYTTADASQLSVKDYSAAVRFHSNAGDAQVPVQVQVIAAHGPKHAQLRVNPLSVNLGMLAVNQQGSSYITIGNTGTQPLKWAANTGGTSWLSLSPASGSIQPGAIPQTVTVNASTAQLAASSYSATLNISSNGGNVDVGVALTVSSPSNQNNGAQPPVIQPSVTRPPSTPSLKISPSSLNTTSSVCSQNGDGTFTCTVILGETSSGTLSWSASTATGASISPVGGQLSASSPQQSITVASLPCQNGAITFSPSNGTASVTVSWSCSTTPPPAQLGVSPQGVSFDNVAANSTQSQQLTISNSGGQTLSWSATASSSWLSLDTSSGTVSGSSSQTINVIASTQGLSGGSYSGTVSFTSNGGSLDVAVSLSVVASNPPVLSVDQQSVYANNACTWVPGSGRGVWTCSVTLRNAQDASSSLSWSSSSSGFDAANMTASFSPASDQISPGGSESVTITILTGSSQSSCWSSFSATLTFTGPNTVNVPWSCNDPTYAASPGSLNGDSDCQHSSGNPYVCTVTLTQQSQGYINFSTEQSGNGSASATFSPGSGSTYGPGQSVTVTVTITVSGSCPASVSLIFLTISTVTVPWSCTTGNSVTSFRTGSGSLLIENQWRREDREAERGVIAA